MTHRLRKLLLVVLAVLLLLPFVAYWAIDAWLESSGGKRMLERNLSARTGMEVRLQGDFDLMLLPDIGVSGTQLIIRSTDENETLAQSAEYEISVALKPLIDGQVQIDWIRLTDGEFYPGRYRSGAATGDQSPREENRIPQIDQLAIRDFSLVLPGSPGQALQINRLELNGFADRRQAPFRLEIEDLVDAEGWMLLDAAASRLDLGSLEIRRQEQSLAGRACLFMGEPFSAQLVLEAGVLDLDRLTQDLPDLGMGAGDGDESATPDVRIQLSVAELKSGTVTASGVVLNLGDDPECAPAEVSAAQAR